jgi:hypothetical protein
VSQAWLKQLPPGITPLILAYNASSVPITRLALSRRSIPEQGLFDRDASPPALDIQPIGDQSLFVKGAISGVVREGVIAASLTGLMILLFLGSWRSTLIITISIPLSMLCSIIALSSLGETINIMTLGDLALAVGILVDDATVAIESINTHLEKARQSREPFSTVRARSPSRLWWRRSATANDSRLSLLRGKSH